MENTCPRLSETSPCLPGIVAESLEDIIYVSDPETYDVLWLNSIGQRRLGIESFHGCKCHKLFQGLETPCPFCPLDRLSFDSFYVWEHANPVMGRHFLVKDKLVFWEGRAVHLEVAVDITAQAEQRKSAQRRLEIERTIVECVRILLREQQLSSAIDKVLDLVGRQYGADRAYVFEFDVYSEDSPRLSNTHEWCAPGVVPQRNSLQHVPFGEVSPWFEQFKTGKDVIIEDMALVREQYPEIHAILEPQNIRRLFVVPLHLDGKPGGFIGADKPRMDGRDLSLLHSLAYFVDVEISKRRAAEELRFLGLRDPLTGMGNRNAYLAACRALKDRADGSLGVIFIDLNDLKYVNDTFGHERGDEYIRTLSELFLKHFRSRDIFRIGGDEFVFLCENMPEALFNAKIRSMLKEGEERFPRSIALGAVWGRQAENVESMVQEADRLMYAEKQRQKAERGTGEAFGSFPK